MSNPYSPPEHRSSRAPGAVDLSAAWQVAAEGAMRNIVPLLVASVVSALLGGLSLLLCVLPALVVIPAMSWALARMELDSARSDLELSAMFAGFDRLGERAIPMLGLQLLLLAINFAVSCPFSVVETVVRLVAESTDSLKLVGLGWSACSQLVVLVITSYLGLRLSFSTLIVVDQGAGVVDAIQRSWALSSGRMLTLLLASFIIALALACVAAPGLGLLAYGVYVATTGPVKEAAILALVGGGLITILPLMPVSVVASCWWAAIYRQLVPASSDA